ncbi:hypothetical protein T492DRAFT_1080302 [Pavlovales sp. CCMP2436]|nr:hypothetical protein T492DRAFT_1080302 [Pavlovales sp. CCMP2436]
MRTRNFVSLWLLTLPAALAGHCARSMSTALRPSLGTLRSSTLFSLGVGVAASAALRPPIAQPRARSLRSRSPGRALPTMADMAPTMAAAAGSEEAYWSGTLFLSISGADEIALRVDFVEELGYEPPQGPMRVDACPAFPSEGTRTRWLLSEDPDDRKDSLWIWGLFKEPLYPFILFELSLEVACQLPESDGAVLPAGVYYFQGGHARDGAIGAVLTSGKIMRKVGLEVPLLVGESATYMEPFEVGTFVARRAR